MNSVNKPCPHCGVSANQLRKNARTLVQHFLRCTRQYFLDYRNNLRSYEQQSIEDFLKSFESKEKIHEAIADNNISRGFLFSYCLNCEKQSIFVGGQLVYPKINQVEKPNDDLPEEVKTIYMEAANIADASPRASAALLRVALQQLLDHLGRKEKNLSDAIENFLQEKSDRSIQQAMKVVRITGNHATHPGKIDFSENPEMAHNLFWIINFIADRVLTDERKIKQMHESLPGRDRAHSDKKDENK